MKTSLFFLLLIVLNFKSYSQKITTDIFDDLEYESEDNTYSSNLKKTIFDDLIYTDTNKNEVKIDSKYMKLQYGHIIKSEKDRIRLFQDLIKIYYLKSNRKASYSADIFDDIKIEDNEGTVKIGTDIFGNKTFDRKFKNNTESIRTSLNGTLIYKSSFEEATLQKNISNHWVYKDSLGNEIKFSAITWGNLKNEFQTHELIFDHLIRNFLKY